MLQLLSLAGPFSGNSQDDDNISSLRDVQGNNSENRRNIQQVYKQEQHHSKMENSTSSSNYPSNHPMNTATTTTTLNSSRPNLSPTNSSKSLSSCESNNSISSSSSSWFSIFGVGNDVSSQAVVNNNKEMASSAINREWIEYWHQFMSRVENEYQCQDENIERACELVKQQVPLIETRIEEMFDEMFRKLQDCKLEMKKSVHSHAENKLKQLAKLKHVKSEWNGWLKEDEPIKSLKEVAEKINDLRQSLKDLPNVKQAHEFELLGMDAEIDWFLDSVRVDHYIESSNDHSILKMDQKFWDQLSRSKFRNLCEQDETYQLQMGLKNIKSNRISRAIQWLELSASQGNSLAQYQLGCLYQLHKKDVEQAKSWFEKAHDNIDALNDLGCIYSNECNYSKAKELFEKSAIKGHALAQKNLGGLYLNGMGVEKDYEMAKEWLEKSACQGNSDAQYYLGCLYYYGFAKEESNSDADSKAIRWFQKSAAQGNEEANKKLMELLEEIKEY